MPDYTPAFQTRKRLLVGFLAALCIGTAVILWLGLSPFKAGEKSAAVESVTPQAVQQTLTSPTPQAPAIPILAVKKSGDSEANPHLASVKRRVENGYTVLDWPNGKPFVRGEEIIAYIERSATEEKYKSGPNQVGRYPRVFVDPQETVKVKLEFPTSPTDTPVAVWQEDGGKLLVSDEVQNSVALKVDANHSVEFQFTATSNQGMHRVVFHTPGGQPRILNFWVGEDNVYERDPKPF